MNELFYKLFEYVFYKGVSNNEYQMISGFWLNKNK